MKYIKQYENNTKPQIGDYVIVKDSMADISLAIFFSENIGRIVNNEYQELYPFLVQFENIPYDFKIEFHGGGTRQFDEDEIIEFSSNKKDLELILTANKYNL
jgi:hypothetical protein